jgi:hypothetical protein
MEEEVRGRPFDEGEMRSRMIIRFGSIRVREGDTQRCMARRHGLKRRWRLGRPKVGEDPRVSRLGPEWSERPGLAREFPQKNQVGLPRLLGQIEELNRKASISIFEYMFKAFGFKFKGSKYFQTKFELMPTWNKFK